MGFGARRYSDERAAGMVFSHTSFFGAGLAKFVGKRTISAFLRKSRREAHRP
jgi:hypothetical protein